MYKFLTTILSLKIRNSLLPETKENGAVDSPIRSFEQFLGHLVSPDKPQSYDFYERCSRTLMKVAVHLFSTARTKTSC